MTTLAQIQAAGAAGRLLPSTVENLTLWFAAGLPERLAERLAFGR